MDYINNNPTFQGNLMQALADFLNTFYVNNKSLPVLGTFGGGAIEVNSAAIKTAVEIIDNIVDANGNAKCQLYVNKNGTPTEVFLDTVAPYTTVPIPVALVDITGTTPVHVDIAGDLHVYMKHTANPVSGEYASTRIGDGTNLVGVTASNEMKVTSSTNPPTSIPPAVYNGNIGLTATQITSISTPCKKCWVTAANDNTGYLTIGGSALVAGQGVILYAGDTLDIEISNVNLLYATSSVAGEDVTVTYTN